MVVNSLDGGDGSFFFISEHGYDQSHDVVSRPHTISQPVDFTQLLSAILACPAETVLVLLHLLFSRDPDRQHLCCNNELVTVYAVQAMFGTACCLRLLVVQANWPSLVRDF